MKIKDKEKRLKVGGGEGWGKERLLTSKDQQ